MNNLPNGKHVQRHASVYFIKKLYLVRKTRNFAALMPLVLYMSSSGCVGRIGSESTTPISFSICFANATTSSIAFCTSSL